MNTRPPDDETPDEVDDLYRRAAALDPSRPSESVRRSIMDHAARVAAERAAQREPTDIRTARRATQRQWRPAVFGTLAAAILAGFVVIPRLWTPPAPPRDRSAATAMLPAAPAPNPQNSPAPPALLDELQSPSGAAVPPAVAPPRISEEPSAGRAARNAVAPRSAAAGASAKSAEDYAQAESSAGLAKVTVTAQKKAAASPQSPQPSSPQAAQPAQPAQAAQLARAAQGAQAAQPAQAQAPQADAAAKFARSQSSLQGLAAAFPARQRVDAGAALRRAAQTGDILALNQALDQPVDVNARDDSGRTALMLAILNGRDSAVDALLAHGADPNAADAKGMTPLEAALNRADPSIISSLRRGGAREPQ